VINVLLTIAIKMYVPFLISKESGTFMGLFFALINNRKRTYKKRGKKHLASEI